MSSDWKPIWEKVKLWHDAGRDIVLATVINTWGSSPRPTGSYMIIDNHGNIEGSVSGGCIEGAVIIAAQDVMVGKKPQILTFSVSNDQAWEVGLSCGGQVRVLVESIEAKLPFIDAILEATRPVMLITDCISGVTQMQSCDDLSQKSKLTEENGAIQFTQILEQPIRMIVIGAVHITQAMVKMAQSLDIDISVIDPRTTFASSMRFPDVDLCCEWPDEAMAKREITSGTAIITLTHDPKLDDPALELAIKSNAFYIAALGSKKTHAARRERLVAKGYTAEEIERIHGPAGLRLGAKTPAEIALSVVGQMISIYRTGQSL